MSTIECYEPDFVRAFLSRSPGSPLHARKAWQHEVRHSLLLTEADCCETALGDPHAFTLHVSECEAEAESLPLTRREQALNQAALNCVTLPGLPPEQRLYALGIMLSYSKKLPGDSDQTLAQVASLPDVLEGYALDGELQAQFASLPPVLQLQRQLITLLGSIGFDWQILPDSARKISLPLQVAMLSLQDANSEALLQEQLQANWHRTHQQYFAPQAWVFSNYLIYRLYHDMFPQHQGASVGQRYFELTTDFFLIRTLFSLWTLDGSPLNPAEIFATFALFERWRLGDAAAALRQQIQALLPGDVMLSAFSLLTP
ncbi:hypothetical protein [Phytobacter massiliensis]|uniref:hypothetical protein n=1 Tax=Phytobacter massiliensis TaxID=1485952 RepID=UPI000313C957|nr:hypothetical protein [Phytobacter massiliensis]